MERMKRRMLENKEALKKMIVSKMKQKEEIKQSNKKEIGTV